MKRVVAIIVLAFIAIDANAWGWNPEKAAKKAKKMELHGEYELCSNVTRWWPEERADRREVYVKELLSRNAFEGRDLKLILENSYGVGMSYDAFRCVYPKMRVTSTSYSSFVGRITYVEVPRYSSRLVATFINGKLESWMSFPF